jgi:hypothetical protein
VPELETILGFGVMVGGISYAIGMVISSRKKGTGDALGIAIDEIEVMKGRADRLEKELIAVQGEVHALQKENDVLRQLLVTRSDLDERLITKLEDALGKQTTKLVAVMREERVA